MKMHFDWRDLFKAPRLALSTGKKLVLQALGLVIGYLGYVLLTYFAFVLAGQTVDETWNYFGLFPIYDFEYGSWISGTVWFIGILFLVAVWMLFSTAVAKVTYEELKGDQFYSFREALRFMKGRTSAILFSPLTLFFLLLFVVMCGAVVGLIGRIPAVGELLFSLMFGLPVFVVGIFAIFVALVFFFSFIITPPAVATLKSDTFTTVLQFFQTIWNQPGRFFGYSAILLVFAKLGVFVFGYFVMRTFQLVNWACGLTMGSKLDEIFRASWSYLPLPDVLDFLTTLYPGSSIAYHFSFYPGGVELAPTQALAAFLIGITLVLIFFIMVAYGLTILTCGQTISFLITYKHREDENLLQRKSEEEAARAEEVEGKIREKLEPEPKAKAKV